MEELSYIFTASGLIALVTLTVLEIILGIDNVIFISIVSGKLPPDKQKRARFWGLSVALIARIALLFTITWLKNNNEDILHVFGYGFSIRDLVLLAGGLFLIYKTTMEIFEKLEGDESDIEVKSLSFTGAVLQIIALDIVFSFDSILTAVGIADHLSVMVLAVIISLGFMLAFAGVVSAFVDKHPSVKMLALSFLLMIGIMLIGESMPEEFNFHVPKGYLYFSMAFSFFVEALNIRFRKKSSKPIHLKNKQKDDLNADIYEGDDSEAPKS